jgi:hypothetical protein
VTGPFFNYLNINIEFVSAALHRPVYEKSEIHFYLISYV